MNPFTYSYPVKVYFGEKAAAKNLAAELAKVGPNVLLAYGGGSIKKNGVYDELIGILTKFGKTVTEFTGIMSNPTYVKVQEGVALAKEKNIDFILAVGGGSVIDCCKIISAQAKLDKDMGFTEEQINRLVVLDLKDQAYFDERGIRDQHGGGGFFAHEADIMGWLFGEH